METHRYTRKLSSSTADSYNTFSDEPFAFLQAAGQQEYWTNGTTHLMSSTPVPAQRQSAVPVPATPFPTTITDNGSSSSSTAFRDKNVVRNSLLAGSVSGMSSTAALYPLDVLRTKMQAAGMAGTTATTTTTATMRGPLAVLDHTLKHGGVRALYTGLTLPLAAQAVYKATVFTVNNVTQAAVLDYRTWENQKTGLAATPGQLTDTDLFVCGATAGAVNAAAFVTPVEFVRNQLIAQHSAQAVAEDASGTKQQRQQHQRQQQSWKSRGSSWDVVQKSSRHGLRSLWRGVSWTVYRDALGCGCFFYMLAWTQRQLTLPDEQPSPAATMVAGGVAGLSFWAVALPLDTVKTWIQSSDLDQKVVSVHESVEKIYRQEGTAGVVRHLFRGWQVAYTRGIPSAAITMSIYSWSYRYLEGVE